MNVDFVRMNLELYWAQVANSGIPTSELPADVSARIDQIRSQITSLLGQHGLLEPDMDDSTRNALGFAFLVGGLAAVDGVVGDIEMIREMVRAEPFAETFLPALCAVWLRAWAMEVSQAINVEVR